MVQDFTLLSYEPKKNPMDFCPNLTPLSEPLSRPRMTSFTGINPYYTLSDKISADKTAENMTCCRKFLSAENFVRRNILSAEI